MPDWMNSQRYKDYIKAPLKKKEAKGSSRRRGASTSGTDTRGGAMSKLQSAPSPTVRSPFDMTLSGNLGSSFAMPAPGSVGPNVAGAPPASTPGMAGRVVANAKAATGGGRQTDAMDGFAGRYAPGTDFTGLLYSNPGALVEESLKAMGVGNGGGLVNLMSQNADQYNWMNMLMNGDQGRQSMEDEQSINYINGIINASATPGGRMPNQEVMLKNLLDAPKGSALAALMEGAPGDQVQIVNQLANVAYGGSNPLMQRAVQNRLTELGRQYINNAAKGTDGVAGGNRSYANWLQVNGGDLF